MSPPHAGVTGPASLLPPPPLGLFEGYGVEVEYMIVDARTLNVLPVADRLLERLASAPASEVTVDGVAWSNELVLHVLELKTDGPVPSLRGVAALVQREVERANALLQELGARLMPGGMHPWMDPATETRLWPHEYNEVYRTFDRIFGATGHGWSNLQSAHLNLPFASDEEFGRLHGAIRAILPLIPALAASSPVRDGRIGEALDERLAAYRVNARRIPSVAGRVVPDPVLSRSAYEQRILEPIYRDLAPLDPEGILRHEWVNARGAIARFTRGSIEVRLADSQECPRADLAVLAAVSAAVQGLVDGSLGDPEAADRVRTDTLATTLDRTVAWGDEAQISDEEYLGALGLTSIREAPAREVWRHLVERSMPDRPGWDEWREPLTLILDEGPLARRILRALEGDTGARRLKEVYGRLCDDLGAGRLFRSADAHG